VDRATVLALPKTAEASLDGRDDGLTVPLAYGVVRSPLNYRLKPLSGPARRCDARRGSGAHRW
jgi:hypothetical protein